MGRDTHTFEQRGTALLLLVEIKQKILPTVLPYLGGVRNCRRLPAKSEDLFAQPLYMSLLLGRNPPQPLTELRVIHLLSMPGELHGSLSLLSVLIVHPCQ